MNPGIPLIEVKTGKVSYLTAEEFKEFVCRAQYIHYINGEMYFTVDGVNYYIPKE